MNLPLKLYSFAPFDRAARVRWTALELGLPLEEIAVDYVAGEHTQPAYRQKNPFGQVPLIETGQSSMTQSVAICQFLAEQHPAAGLVPALTSPLRASWLSWLFLCASDLDARSFQVFNYTRLRPDADKRADAIKVVAPLLQVLETHLADRDYLVGDSFMLPDIVLGQELVLLGLCKALEEFPNLVRYRDRLGDRPAARASGLFALLQQT
ncbi:MAG: glutathione S-transferase family protein [Rhodanobacteraceae bacterium]|nr:glutathione S-transferase family protein [Rhodanobacteraceae bacterium]